MKNRLIISALAAIILAPAILYLSKFHGGLTDQHGRWGEVGSYFSGIYGSLALLVLAYTAHLTQAQFRRQNEDSIFYKLFDSLQHRIQNSSISIKGKEFSAHKSLKYIVDGFYKELSDEAVEIGRMLFCTQPEKIANVHYTKLFAALNGQNWIETFEEDRAAFIDDITSQGHFNERWDQLKNYIGSCGEEPHSIREALRATGSVNFYKIPFKSRRRHYAAALHRILAEHGEFLDGYLSTILYITDICATSKNSLQYARYAQSQLTRYEVVILFYLLAGSDEKIVGAENLKTLGLLNRLRTPDCQGLMIDSPSVQVIDNEITAVFAVEA
ncbi:hypothetical protein JTE78_25100 [Pseudomonas syringae pv. aptata]|uniref:hypothetical protein n=1 Tax=Pseudomonas syringae TaxID=317 RepID=UPI00203EFA45|nr:hypothetical protein [Pseudomonas syringae]MCK0545922.1 hypothetical protein [Pseudomonas syringae pv. aptata]